MKAKTHRAEKRHREIRMAKAAHAAAAIGSLQPGTEIFILTYGQFSLIDALIHLLHETGPADVILSTWTAASADLTAAANLLEQAQIRSLRFIVDRSFLSRQPDYCARMRQLFGDECIRTTRSHAKFLVIRNVRWNLAVRTSMNLNENPRLENIEISDDPALCDFFQAVADELYREQDPGIFNGELPGLETVPESQSTSQVKMGVARPSISRTD